MALEHWGYYIMRCRSYAAVPLSSTQLLHVLKWQCCFSACNAAKDLIAMNNRFCRICKSGIAADEKTTGTWRQCRIQVFFAYHGGNAAYTSIFVCLPWRQCRIQVFFCLPWRQCRLHALHYLAAMPRGRAAVKTITAHTKHETL